MTRYAAQTAKHRCVLPRALHRHLCCGEQRVAAPQRSATPIPTFSSSRARPNSALPVLRPTVDVTKAHISCTACSPLHSTQHTHGGARGAHDTRLPCVARAGDSAHGTRLCKRVVRSRPPTHLQTAPQSKSGRWSLSLEHVQLAPACHNLRLFDPAHLPAAIMASKSCSGVASPTCSTSSGARPPGASGSNTTAGAAAACRQRQAGCRTQRRARAEASSVLPYGG